MHHVLNNVALRLVHNSLKNICICIAENWQPFELSLIHLKKQGQITNTGIY